MPVKHKGKRNRSWWEETSDHDWLWHLWELRGKAGWGGRPSAYHGAWRRAPPIGDDAYWQNPVMGRKGGTLVPRPYFVIGWAQSRRTQPHHDHWGGCKGRAGGHEPTTLLTAGSPTRRGEQGIPMAAIPTPLLHQYCPIFYDTKTICNLSLNCQFRGAEKQGSRETKRKRDWIRKALKERVRTSKQEEWVISAQLTFNV